jgi:hypothetical protein
MGRGTRWTAFAITAAVISAAVAMVVGPASGASSTSQSTCIAKHSQEYVWYTSSCTGHDEP